MRNGAISPPNGLREAILAGGKVGHPKPLRRLSRRPAWLAMAASVLVLLSLAGVWQNRRAAAAQEHYAEFAVNDALYGHPPMTHQAAPSAFAVQLGNAALKLPGRLAIE